MSKYSPTESPASGFAIMVWGWETFWVKLEQNQVWQKADEFIRIVQLERLEVQYKLVYGVAVGRGTHHHVSKKEFCRLIKGAVLLDLTESSAETDGPGGI